MSFFSKFKKDKKVQPATKEVDYSALKTNYVNADGKHPDETIYVKDGSGVPVSDETPVSEPKKQSLVDDPRYKTICDLCTRVENKGSSKAAKNFFELYSSTIRGMQQSQIKDLNLYLLSLTAIGDSVTKTDYNVTRTIFEFTTHTKKSSYNSFSDYIHQLNVQTEYDYKKKATETITSLIPNLSEEKTEAIKMMAINLSACNGSIPLEKKQFIMESLIPMPEGGFDQSGESVVPLTPDSDEEPNTDTSISEKKSDTPKECISRESIDTLCDNTELLIDGFKPNELYSSIYPGLVKEQITLLKLYLMTLPMVDGYITESNYSFIEPFCEEFLNDGNKIEYSDFLGYIKYVNNKTNEDFQKEAILAMQSLLSSVSPPDASKIILFSMKFACSNGGKISEKQRDFFYRTLNP